jgi:pyruvate ferredoxin oxidoreductase gamma subunit
MLSIAAFLEGRHAQAFPTFGSERTGAPVVSFCRIDDKEIRVREPIMRPDALIVQDPTLLGQAGLFSGLGPDGYVLINSAHGIGELGLDALVTEFRRERLLTVPATD